MRDSPIPPTLFNGGPGPASKDNNNERPFRTEQRSFAETRANANVAPIAAIYSTAVETHDADAHSYDKGAGRTARRAGRKNLGRVTLLDYL